MKRTFARILLAALMIQSVHGQISWTARGPGAGSFLISIAIHPENPDILYVGGDIEGVYKSIDGAALGRR